MSIWKQKASIEGLNNIGKSSMVGHLGIEITAIGEDFLLARMPVNEKTKQPMGLLHGGASAALAETLGSMASLLCLEDPIKKATVGIDISASHIRSARSGFVHAKASPLKIGQKLHVWEITIKDDQDRLVCVSRLTCMIIDQRV